MSLVAEGLTKVFGGLHAVDGFGIRVDRGEVVGLIGPNGAGKTTSFNLLTGQLKPTSGTVTLGGRDVTGLPPWRLAALGVARTFQHPTSFSTLSVGENLDIALAARATFGRRERAAQSAKVLASVAPDARQDAVVKDLSYGAQRRVAIAIALANEPEFVLLDEPAAGLNPIETEELGSLIRTIAAGGVGVLLVEHDLDLISSVVDRLEVMNAGKPLFSGTAEEAMNHPDVLEAYIGRGKPHA